MEEYLGFLVGGIVFAFNGSILLIIMRAIKKYYERLSEECLALTEAKYVGKSYYNQIYNLSQITKEGYYNIFTY